jgi:hypothetical protein
MLKVFLSGDAADHVYRQQLLLLEPVVWLLLMLKDIWLLKNNKI